LLSSTTLLSVASRFWNCTIWGVAVAQGSDEGLQVLDDLDDVAAAVGKIRPTPDS